ncbi:unnamed protein product [Oikopleura dioica]|uniref:Uncharacterized protein n=1 Tax=Oikopleura dioica TaxID=34765 RepID=E4Y8B1_OIKDI|nr:unnamed protein product [Oikopleura dioica]
MVVSGRSLTNNLPAKSFNAIPHKYESSSRDRDSRRRDDRDRDDRKRRSDRDRLDRGTSSRDQDRNKKRRGDDEFDDPMDPAAYSDAPKGNWSRGIPRPGESVSTAGVPQVEL